MSGNEVDLSECSDASGEDFSGSEDDWVPTKKGRRETSSSDEDTDDDFEESPVAKAKLQNSKLTVAKSLPVKRHVAVKSKEKKRNDNDDSDSSGDDHLVDPRTLDLTSKFFSSAAGPSAAVTSKIVPTFDCNVGLNLSDSDEDDNNEFEAVTESKPTTVNLSRNVIFNANLDKARHYLESFRSKSIVKDDQQLDVTKLLAIGESSYSTSPPAKNFKETQSCDSESDWEDVGNNVEENASDVVITLGPTVVPKVDKTQQNIDASIKRKLNRQKKDAQLIIHKVHVLCWIAHGNYLNKILNDNRLMKMCLAFMPSKSCYPKDRTDIEYFGQIANWYKSQMSLKSDRMHAELKKLPPLAISLALQIEKKSAICKKDYVLIFVILLRAIGIQCRLVLNLVPVPIRPATSELLVISTKAVEITKESPTLSVKKSLNKGENTSKTIPTNSVSKPMSSGNLKPSTISDSPISPKPSTSNQKSPKNSTGLKASVSSIKMSTSKKSALSEDYVTKSKGPSIATPMPSKSLREKLNATKANETNTKSKPSEKAPAKALVTPFTKTSSLNVLSSPVSRRTRSKGDAKPAYKPVLPQMDGADDRKATKRKNPNLSKLRASKTPMPSSNDKTGSDSDSDFVASPKKRAKLPQPKAVQNVKKATKRLDRRVLSTDEDNENDESMTKRNGMDVWIEVFTEVEEKWIAIDLFKPKIDCVPTIRNAVTKPVRYVFAWNNNNTIKDVSSRYCSNWNTVTRKMRVESDWLSNALHAYVEKPTLRSRMEDMELNKIHLKEPLPTVISEFKDHPLYALERHLLKFQAIYPPDALTLGYIRKEAVYARECVHTLHSREIWVKQARTVMPAQTPYKIVKARPKWDRQTNKMLDALPLEIFGIWQTKPYEPPTAENGIVPRNAYGNVELFKPEMLPKKTVHLQLPSLNRTCKKMGVDCAQAVVGFDFHSGSSHPTFDGFVVCEEFAEKVVAQWWLDQEEAQRKEEEKINQRVYGNWKKLVRGLMIRQHLQRKYNFSNTGAHDGKRKKIEAGAANGEVNATKAAISGTSAADLDGTGAAAMASGSGIANKLKRKGRK